MAPLQFAVDVSITKENVDMNPCTTRYTAFLLTSFQHTCEASSLHATVHATSEHCLLPFANSVPV